MAKIDYPKNHLNISNNQTVLTVYIPETYNEEVFIDSVSGDISIDSIELEELVIESVSGRIRGEHITADTFEAKSTSGNVIIRELTSKQVKVDNISGNIEIGIPQDYYLDLDSNTVSGGDVSTRDGRADRDSEEIHMDLSTISGDIDISRF